MRKWLPLITISLGTFMLLIDVTIVNVALPSMATDLRTSFSSLQWVIDIYALTLAALLLGIGALSDLVGRRPVYIAGLVVFAGASLAGGLASDPTMLIVARGVQGIGAAAMFATTMALLNSSYQGADRGIAFGVWGAVTGAAAATGPLLGGLLTQGISWRAIFFVNLPLSVVAVALSVWVLPRREQRRAGRIDLPGVVAFTAAAAALTLGLTRASAAGWGSAQTLGLLGGGVAALAAFALIELRVRQPLLELALLRDRQFSGVIAAAFLLSIAAFASLTYMSLWLQSVRGMSPIASGLTLVPLSGAALAVSVLGGRFLHGDLRRLSITGGLALIGAGALLQTRLAAGADGLDLLPGLIVAGVGVGLATPTLASTALSAVPPQRGGMASGALNTARQLGYALGIAGLGVIVQTRISDRLGRAATAVTAGQSRHLLAAAPVSERGRLDAAIHAAFVSGLTGACMIAGVAGLAGAALVFVCLRPGRAAPAVPAPAVPAPAVPAPAVPAPAVPAEVQRSAAGQMSR